MPTGASSSGMLLSSPTTSMMLHLPSSRQPSDDTESGAKSDLELEPASAGAGTSSSNMVFESTATEELKHESRLEEKQTNMQMEFKLESALDDSSALSGEVKMEHDGASAILDGIKSDSDQGSSAQSLPPKPIDKKSMMHFWCLCSLIRLLSLVLPS